MEIIALKFKLNSGKEIELSLDEAREFLQSLKEVLDKPDPIYIPTPSYPTPTPSYPTVPYPPITTPWETTPWTPLPWPTTYTVLCKLQ